MNLRSARARIVLSFRVVLFIFAFALSLSTNSKPVSADWRTGPIQLCYNTCATYEDVWKDWVTDGLYVTYKNVQPLFNADGTVKGYQADMLYWCCQGAIRWDQIPSLPKCSGGEIVDATKASGCRPPNPVGGDPEKSCSGFCRSPEPPSGVGNPIDVGTGNKYQEELDYSSNGTGRLAFVRYYNSRSNRRRALGLSWTTTYDSYLSIINNSTTVVRRPNGRAFTFTKSQGSWSSDADVQLKLKKAGNSWEVTTLRESVETFDSSGRLTSLALPNGYTQTLSYTGTRAYPDVVSDSDGRSLSFTYDASNYLVSMTTTDGLIYLYERPDPGSTLLSALLTKVIYPDATPGDLSDNPTREYIYDDPNMITGLTGIIDEEGNRYATWAYDADGWAILSEHAGGAERTTIVYDKVAGTATVTGPLGDAVTFSFTLIENVRHVAQKDRAASLNYPAAGQTFTYDAAGYLASGTDWKGNLTNYVYDARGLQTSRTEAAGTAAERTITTTWDADLRVPTQIVEPGRTTDLTYDANLNLLTRTITDITSHSVPYSTNGQTRGWTYSYTAGGLLASVDGPRTGVSDLTSFAYDASGNRISVTDALGFITNITAHNGRGLPLTVVDPNGVTTTLAYTERGWLKSRTIEHVTGNATTSFTYTGSGQIAQVILPNGTSLDYEYDAAHRLTAVSNSLGERIDYTIDAMGNRTATVVKSATSSIVRTQSAVFDELGRLLESIGAAAQTTAFAYDANGNATSVTDPGSNVTAAAFDALDRLIATTDALTGIAASAFDGNDNLTSVTDQRSFVTSYVYNGFGDVIQESSPDTGVTVYVLDAAGNATRATDSRGVITDYTYDALNRALTRTFAATPAENVAYTYDEALGGNFGIGRLTSLTDQSGSTAFVYDHRGNVIEETRIIDGVAYVTSYAFDLADNLTAMIYPSGRIVSYLRDSLGRVTKVQSQADELAAPVTVAENITYMPFGPMQSLLLGNGLTLSYSFDQDYRLSSIVAGDGVTDVQNLSYVYNGIGNITAITDAVDAARNEGFTYDALQRLIDASGLYGAISYTYDAVGNRLSREQISGTTTTEAYSYDTVSNRLLSVSDGTEVRGFAYTAAGNISVDDKGTAADFDYTYSDRNRLRELALGGIADTAYRYNAMGQRVAKEDLTGGGQITHFHYGQNGEVLGLSDGLGTAIEDYVFLNGLMIAQILPEGGGGTITDIVVDNSDPAAQITGPWSTLTTGSGFEGLDWLEHHRIIPVVPPGGQLIDNSDAAFSFIGNWPVSTNGVNFEGADFRERTAGSNPVDVFIVDNLDPGFSVYGTWGTATHASDWGADFRYHSNHGVPPLGTSIDNVEADFSTYEDIWTLSNFMDQEATGANYAYKGANIPVSQSIIVDNDDPSVIVVGPWIVRTGDPGIYGADYLYKQRGGGTSWVIWPFTIPASGDYMVFARWPTNGPGGGTKAWFRVYHAGGETVTQVDQIENCSSCGEWVILGTYTFDILGDNKVQIKDTGSGPYQVRADAIYVVPVEASPNIATWLLNVPDADEYNVYARWVDWFNRATNAKFTIFNSDADIVSTKNQKVNGKKWNLLGTANLAPGLGHRVELNDRSNGFVIADSVMYIKTADFKLNTATWQPVVTIRDYYDIYMWYKDWAGSRWVPLSIEHDEGVLTTTFNQASTGGAWKLLSSGLLFSPGGSPKIEITDWDSESASFTIYADAVKLEHAPTKPRSASWSFTAAATGSHDIYVKWVPLVGRATDSTYTVNHDGGATPVIIDQSAGEGFWTLLGSYNLTASQAYTLDLSDQGNGSVSADAIYVVETPAPEPPGPPDAVSWTPDLPAPGNYEVFVKYQADASRASAVYTIVHAAGSTDVPLDQTQNGGIWVSLGSFDFDAGTTGSVSVPASTAGTISADAVRFLTESAPAGDTVYVLSDHLGTPQKLVDQDRLVVWDRVQTPFGLTHSETAAPVRATNVRFPGQRADAESGLHYNYFRDYDPSTGRYIESDPIGLAGGLNTYGYVSGNPLMYSDPLGLEIKVQWHEVGDSGEYHLSLKISPENQTKYANHESFKQLNGKGKLYATLGAGPNGIFLKSDINRDTDFAFHPDSASAIWDIPPGCEDWVIESLFKFDNAYNDSLLYNPTPKIPLWAMFAHVIAPSYNSNSYIAGLANAIDIPLPSIPVSVPGINTPVPEKSFGKGKKK